MATKTIPQLQLETEFDENAMFIFDSGVQTFRIEAPDLAHTLLQFPATVPALRTSGFSIQATDVKRVNRLDSSGGAFNIQLPDPTTVDGFVFPFKDVAGYLSSFPVTLLRNGGELFEGLAADFLLEADFGAWSVYSDGTNWHLI